MTMFGGKKVIVHLFRDAPDGEILHQVDIGVLWMNFTTCIHPDDGLRYCQFLMVLKSGKRIFLPIIEKDAEFTVLYQGQRFNRWECEVCLRERPHFALRRLLTTFF